MPDSFLPPSAIHLRDARLEDAPAIQRALFPDRPLPVVKEMLSYAFQLRREGRGVVAVAEVDGEVRAAAQLSIRDDGGEIHDMIVAEGWRERGLGRALIGYLIGAARGRKVRRLEIAAASSNARALSLYERLGFAVDRTLDLDLGAGPIRVVYLAKALD